MVILIAGKAHPADAAGKELIREIIASLREGVFNGRVIFLEEYDLTLARYLVQGVDLWLNTPILGHEACGTSGMKAAVNGALNFSTGDGWWDEVYNKNIGWQIASLTEIKDIDKRNDLENRLLLDTLESEIIPLYYNRGVSNYSDLWVEKIKASMALIAYRYNTSRMVRDYFNNLYCPSLLYSRQLWRDNLKDVKAIVAWRNSIADLFNTVKIKAILIDGIKNGKIISSGVLKVEVLVFLGKMSAHELAVEVILIKNDEGLAGRCPLISALHCEHIKEEGVLTYKGECTVDDTGFYSYAIRITPLCNLLFHKHEVGLALWG